MKRVVLLFALVLPVCALATPAGISGFSGKGGTSICSSCHAGGAVPTVSLAGPAALVAGNTGTYTVTITGGAGVNAGLDAALGGVNSGSATFTAGPGTKVLNGEVVHSGPKAFAGGSAVFTFSVKAPLTAGQFTLAVAGLSSNNNLGANGDEAAKASLNVNVTLGAGSGTPDAGSVPAPVVDAGSTPPPAPVPPTPPGGAKADAGTLPAPATGKPDPLPMGNGNNRYNTNPLSDGVIEGESGCSSSSGGMPMVVLVALLGGALLRSKRRSTVRVEADSLRRP